MNKPVNMAACPSWLWVLWGSAYTAQQDTPGGRDSVSAAVFIRDLWVNLGRGIITIYFPSFFGFLGLRK